MPVRVGLISPGHELIRIHVPPRGRYVGGLGTGNKKNQTHLPQKIPGGVVAGL